MSWLLNLYETYDRNIEEVGKTLHRPNGQEYTLLPISHTTQTAHIEVAVTPEGNFHSAHVITDKNKAVTLIPTTEESSSRAGSKIAPYPLHDKLSYVAGDFVAYGGKIKKEEPFSYYIAQLKEWSESPSATAKVQSIYHYLKKKNLIKDLIEEKVLWIDDNQHLLDNWNGTAAEKPSIFSTVTGGQESAFIRFTVYDPSALTKSVWNDEEMYESFIKFYNELLGNEDTCYVTGKMLPSTERHANKIRNAGDKAKLISANDKSGYTFRGRFREAFQVASISYEVSQKAHNALKWLINKQARIIDGRVFLVWGNKETNVPNLLDDSQNVFDDYELEFEDVTKESKITDTESFYAEEFSKGLAGYKAQIEPYSKVQILVLDSATTGRMAVLYYRNIEESVYLEKMEKWYESCVWQHSYMKNKAGKFIRVHGTPSPRDIAFAAHGLNANDKVIKGVMERILACIIDDQEIPVDITRSARQRASNPVGMENWEWEKTLSIACAIINRKERYSVALDHETNDRDYLFGRLLAIADVLERNALGEDKRATNARRYMNTFAQHPARTWTTIQAALQPYQARQGEKVSYFNWLLDQVGARIKLEDYTNRPLSGMYLLGFYSQRAELYSKKENTLEAVEEE